MADYHIWAAQTGAMRRWVREIGGVKATAKSLKTTQMAVQGWLDGSVVPSAVQRVLFRTKAKEARVKKGLLTPQWKGKLAALAALEAKRAKAPEGSSTTYTSNYDILVTKKGEMKVKAGAGGGCSGCGKKNFGGCGKNKKVAALDLALLEGRITALEGRLKAHEGT